MKRVIFCIIGWVLVLGLHAQIVENMRIYTDKDCYVAGEDLWITLIPQHYYKIFFLST